MENVLGRLSGAQMGFFAKPLKTKKSHASVPLGMRCEYMICGKSQFKKTSYS
jgi:hypothetical protein